MLLGSVMVSGLTFMSLIHFELIFAYGVKTAVQFQSFDCVSLVFQTPFIEEAVFSILCSLLICCKLIIFINVG